MKARTMIGIVAAAIWLTSTAFSDQYDDLIKKGYRWVTTGGPFACRSKEIYDGSLKTKVTRTRYEWFRKEVSTS